ncbi:hypothetical protein Desti_4190 [Desulfomonile tiedjei DSM 6799]|uniref:Uncharacterized protein n=1 Tax=Desulfomonile tiedjei (strain ATCC 49306 / DSM 6799 / DCB-1) TaxID=706587 RepID=I4CB86_DESTA|nr:hypothetical protein Desti_4190 [Desulfomonile tiedjei DSM 6799]
MNMQDDAIMQKGSESEEELGWVRDRQTEMNEQGCSVLFEDDRCSCEEPQSATEFFLTGPSDCACDCESC